uniref:AlNc14C142G7281 protein n=1 Tax=Albugo laibachii Nc14 TaxID=890382 RepID=F0WL92_9STRA|nr:AlNc14C142G7281 [Albugo laibachii Nc14]|eukprot:CCA22054.1 AlNc14C142G7281 [Albugo laibachii Nc14]
MSREALEMTPPRRVSRVVSPSTYFGASQRGYAGAEANVEMAHVPQLELPKHYVLPPIYQPPPPPHIAPGPQYGRVPDTRQKVRDSSFRWSGALPRTRKWISIVGQAFCAANFIRGTSK